MKEWLNNLKVNDKVITLSSYSSRQITTIKRITKTMLILTNRMRFNKTSGYSVGNNASNWCSNILEAYDEKKAKKIKRVNQEQYLLVNMTKLNLSKLTEEELIIICKIVYKYKNKLIQGKLIK